MKPSIDAAVTVRTEVAEPGLAFNHSEAWTTVRTEVATPGLTQNHSQAVTLLG